jgi:hypothetical protein
VQLHCHPEVSFVRVLSQLLQAPPALSSHNQKKRRLVDFSGGSNNQNGDFININNT